MLSFVQSPSDQQMAQICMLYCEAFNAPEKGENWTLETAERYFHEESDETSLYALKIDEDQKLSVFAFGGRFGEGEFYLSQFVVSKDARGQGLGRAVLRKYVAHVRRLDYTSMTVRCRSDNDVMVALLESEGFQIFKRYEDTFGGVTCSRLMFQKDL